MRIGQGPSRSKANPAARIAALTADFVVAVESNEGTKGWQWPRQEFSHFEDRYGSDYSIVGFEDQIGVQRKAADDLIGSLDHKNGQVPHLESQIVRLAKLRFPAVVAECGAGWIESHGYVSQVHPHSAIATLIRICCQYRVPCWFAGNRLSAQFWAAEWLEKSWRLCGLEPSRN